MGLGLILFLVAVLISLIVFIVFLVKTFRHWGILHSILLSILFIESWTLLYLTAGVQHERVRATRDAYRFRKEFEDQEARGRRLRFGSVDAPADSLEAVIPVQGMLDRITVDRGRVWRQLSLANHQDNRIELTAPARAAADGEQAGDGTSAPAAARALNLPQDLVVYCFEEQLTEEGGYPLPVFYLGEYRVVASDQASGRVTLQSTQPLHPSFLARIQQGGASWALYETLPIDSHLAFATPGSEPTTEEIFGHPDEDEIKRLFEGVPESTIDAYLRDGLRASVNDRPETIWELIRLVSDYEVDVDSDQSADASVSGYFDQVGRSVDIRLKRNEPVKLNPDELRDNRVVVIERVARDLVSRGVAERIQPVFVRPLNDYLGQFNRFASQSFELTDRIKYYQYQNDLIDQAKQASQNMLKLRQNENQALTADLGNYQKEIQYLTTSATAAESDLAALKQKLTTLYKAIQERHQKLVTTGL